MNDTYDMSHKGKWRRIRAAAAAAASTAAVAAAFVASAHSAAAGTPAATLSQGVIVHSVGGGLAEHNASTPHCTVELPSNAQRCFVHFRDAIAYATGNRVTDAPNDSRAAETHQAFNAEINSADQQAQTQLMDGPPTAQPQIQTVIATLHWDVYYGGATWTVWVTGRILRRRRQQHDRLLLLLPRPHLERPDQFLPRIRQLRSAQFPGHQLRRSSLAAAHL
jgi:hypothetical protein